ncbi:MAG: ferritin-like domain-containing protein [Streptosporangiaceae bacterium]
MSDSNDAPGGDAPGASASGGGGRLAQIIATRGGLAPPEDPFVIEHREALIYMLCEAAELEHGIMCQYLYAAFTLKQTEAEGLTKAEAAAAQSWRKRISHVAAQEMLHLSLVQNLLSAIGAAPHLSRPNFPQPANHYPAPVNLALIPFGETALRHFMFLERPEGMDLSDPVGATALHRAAPAMAEGEIVPRPQDFATVGHLYRSIEAGIKHLCEKFGEEWLFVGPPRAQATERYFRWPELVPVTDAASAQRAIDEILEQGEGLRGRWQTAHFGQFVAILDEYMQLTEANPAFDPVRPAIPVNVRPAERDLDIALVTDPVTRRVMDMFNVCYEVLLQLLQRFFAHTEETDAQLQALADASVAMMLQAIRPLGDLVTQLPAGPEYPGRTVGPSFELFYESDYVLPHRVAAWVLLTERIREAAAYCEPGAPCDPEVTEALATTRANLNAIADSLAAHLPARGDALSAAGGPASAGDRDTLLARATDYYRTGRVPSDRPDDPAVSGVTALLASAYQLTQTSAGDQRTLSRLVNSVLRPLSALPHSEPPQSQPPPSLSDLATSATDLRVQLGTQAPPGLLEAVAALQRLAVRQAVPGERAGVITGFEQQMRALPPVITTATNGPYLVTNAGVVRDHLGQPMAVPPQLALCRCGASALKPFCDGSHADNGFSGDKDPKRVPDQRDTYPGEQVTVFDNRGICQHSGFCTDRLPTAFRTNAEPFVAPSGGRMDEIVRAVRDCPSGALSLAFDGTEARDLADWHDQRERGITVSLDGPYRVTGGIALTVPDGANGSDGTDEPRAAGSSREHFALCRCGHSQNKPFCSGMHWYVGFRDPVRPFGSEPTLFDWAGGLPGLTRMTRFLYETHVPADDLLAPLFAGMPPGYAEQEAAVMAAAFAGPPPSPLLAPGAAGFTRPQFTEDQRARWVTLATASVQDAGLPADPEFRAALASYLDWVSRAESGAAVPDWDWGPSGPPSEEAGATATETGPDVTLPGPDEVVSFASHIKPLFRESDRRSMSFAFDLWSADDVRTHAGGILSRLQDGTMPCDGAWPADRTEVFRRWTETGCQP